MSPQTPKSKRKAAVVKVPDLKQNAAERKRVLNVLAQRRYRERKREHLQKLESQLDSSTSPPSTHDAGESPGRSHPASEPLGSIEKVAFVAAAASGDVQDAFVDMSAWTPEFFVSSIETWPAATDLPLFPGPLLDAVVSSSTLSSEETETTSTSPSSLGSDEQLPPQNVDFINLGPTPSTRTYTFPDERHTSMLQLRLARAAVTIAKRLNIEDLLWSLDSLSPFTDPALLGLSFDHLPLNLRPTETQQLIPHHPMLDILAWPTMRDKLILVFSLPPDARPPIAASPTALLDFMYDFEDTAEGVRIWGQDPCDAENWEAGETVFKKWWWALDTSILGKSNKWRKQRGAPLLAAGQGFVIDEV